MNNAHNVESDRADADLKLSKLLREDMQKFTSIELPKTLGDRYLEYRRILFRKYIRAVKDVKVGKCPH